MVIRRDHTLGIEEAKRRVDEVAAEIGSEFSLGYRWEGDSLRFNGRGVDGHISVAQDSVEVHVRLGLALMMLSGPIRLAVESSLDQHLPG